jgi:hypothetical protein
MPYRSTPWVLISQSAREGPALLLRKAIRSALEEHQDGDKKPRYKILVDEDDMQVGDAWRRVNEEWLWHSDGVVLLLNKAALRDASFVHYELAMLWSRWRESRDHFRFVIVRFPDVTDELLDQKLGYAKLNEIHQIKLSPQFGDDSAHRDNEKVSSEVKEVAARVAKQIESLQVDQTSHWIEEQLVKTLYHQTPAVIDLRPLCDLLNLSSDILGKGKEEACRVIIRSLIDPKRQIGQERLIELEKTVDHLRTMFSAQEHVRRLINYALPHCWVNPEAAAPLARIAPFAGGPRAFVWVRSWNLSENMYLCRAWCKPLKRVIQVCVKSGDVEDWKSKVRAGLAVKFNRDPATTSTDKLRELIRRNWVVQGEPVWVVLSANLTGSRIIKELSAEWPEVHFFVFEQVGERAKSLDSEWSEFERVAPELDLTLEEDAATFWADLMSRSGVAVESISTGEAFN